jgi:hypothetical protein
LTPIARAFTYLGAVVACALFPACSPSTGVAPTPTAGVSTPAGQSTPPETEQQRKERLDFEAAEKAYRSFYDEYARVQQQVNSSPKPTKVMIENAAGPFLQRVAGFLRDKAKDGRHADRPGRIAYVHRGGYSPNELILLSCQDGSKVRLLDRSGHEIGRGSTIEWTYYLRPVAGRWKIWNAGQVGVKSCEQ